uniref:Uncharacterized protein n=1 Tax=Acrobeloides nanus TaxID=290746 RepID=A0A914D8H1_9BILA
MIVNPFSETCISATPDQEVDGPLLFECIKSMYKDYKEESLVSLIGNKLSVPVKNLSSTPMVIEEGEMLGTVERIEEVYTSSDYVASDIVCQVLKAVTRECLEKSERFDILREFFLPKDDALTPHQVQEFCNLVTEFYDVFALDDNDLGRTNLVTHRIELLDKDPVRVPPRPIPFTSRTSSIDGT